MRYDKQAQLQLHLTRLERGYVRTHMLVLACFCGFSIVIDYAVDRALV